MVSENSNKILGVWLTKVINWYFDLESCVIKLKSLFLYMKTHILTFLFLSATYILNAQQFEWAKSMGDYNYDEARSITTDASGNVYTAGSFSETTDFDPGVGTYILTNAGLDAAFVQKLDSSGNFLWAKSMGETSEAKANSITIDASGNVYTAGYFTGLTDFDPGVGTYILTNYDDDDIFIQKMDSSGNFLWAKSFGSSDQCRAHSITTDASGNVYTTGYFTETVDFDPGVGIFNLRSIFVRNVFIQKMDPLGNFLWAKSLASGGTSEAFSITIDASGNVYTAGDFRGTVDFDPGVGIVNLTSNANGCSDAFVQKMDASGNFLWAKSFGGTGSNYACCWINSITIDASGNVYTAGDFVGTVDFDPGVGTFNLTSSSFGQLINAFIQKLDASGNFLWAKAIGGIDRAYANSITIDASGNVYTAGDFFGIVDFDPGVGTFNLTYNGGGDIFIQKMSQNNTLSLITQIDNSLINLYPNPTSDFVTINIANKSKGQVIVLDLLGKVVLNKEFNSNQIQLSLKSIESKGTYLVKIMDSNGDVIANKKLIYQ